MQALRRPSRIPPLQERDRMSFKFLGKKPPVICENEGQPCYEANKDYCDCRENHFHGALKETAEVIKGWLEYSIIPIKDVSTGKTNMITLAPNKSHLMRLEEMLRISVGGGEELKRKRSD